jgi:hypothetical protein
MGLEVREITKARGKFSDLFPAMQIQDVEGTYLLLFITQYSATA